MSGYDDRTVRITLAHLFNGGRWRRDDAPDPDMPKARSNPATRGTEMAERLGACGTPDTPIGGANAAIWVSLCL